ncbi:hypothetical protein AB1Y20_011479 [Prymnesium parvum]|uniref:Peptidylamidoglycolate lyase n=1 Tax=Prymnesium parvum TaxID=97485 RepID=A0AB34IGI1_PRYPA
MPHTTQTVRAVRDGVNTTVSYRQHHALGGGYQGRTFLHPSYVAALPGGDVVVSDTWHHQLQVLSPLGRLRATIGSFGVGRGELWQPSGVAANNFSIFVAETLNHRVQKIRWPNTSATRVVGSYGRGPAQLRFPHGLLVYNGSLFVADTLNHRIARFWTFALKFAGTFGRRGALPGQLSYPAALAVHAAQLFVADSGNDRISVFDCSGGFLRAFGGAGERAGSFLLPVGIAAADGRLYVSEHHGRRVQVLSPRGEAEHVIELPLGTPAGLCAIRRRGYSQLLAVDSERHVVHNVVYRAEGDRPPNWYAELFPAARRRGGKNGSHERRGRAPAPRNGSHATALEAWLRATPRPPAASRTTP